MTSYTCKRCDLYKTRRSMIEPKGSYLAKYLVICDAPQLSDDTLGKGFVNESSKLLEVMFTKAKIKISDCQFVNIIKCRPCDSVGGRGREPKEEEILACLPYIKDTIAISQHIAVVLVGDLAKKYYRSVFSGVPILTLTDPRIIKIKGGKSSSLFTDNLLKLEAFNDKIIEQEILV